MGNRYKEAMESEHNCCKVQDEGEKAGRRGA